MRKHAVVMLLCLWTLPAHATPSAKVDVQFMRLFTPDDHVQAEALGWIRRHWQPGFTPMAIEVLYFSQNSATGKQLAKLLETKTGQDHGLDIDDWYRWLWKQDLKPHPSYADFKSSLYRLIDPRFGKYFDSQRDTRIRLDEVRWGGVAQDGIPPLRQPKMISAKKATYLDAGNEVFALEINGDARAYPKRILAWHEMFVDTVGGVDVAGVYCTLCGTMVLYETDGHELGTSGFLYRSNKLMYDKKTQSLWNTIKGEPVIGPLAAKDIQLKRLSVVTTTWGEWRRRHPNTSVLSLETGHRRDYSEGAAYRDYFATDELMFVVPKLDARLKNKAEVLALRFDDQPNDVLAISSEFLNANPVHYETVGSRAVVIFTDRTGANRVYEIGKAKFTSWDQNSSVTDADGNAWTLTEAHLVSSSGDKLARVPAHRAFWFGWQAAYPNTRLVR